MSRFSYLIIGLAIIGGVSILGWQFFQNEPEATRVPEASTVEATRGSEDGVCTAVEALEVRVTSEGFVPEQACIYRGGTVTWVNETSARVRVASDPHPDHTDYDGLDNVRGISKGERYAFTFDRVGRWGYHDHQNPTRTGKVVVVQ